MQTKNIIEIKKTFSGLNKQPRVEQKRQNKNKFLINYRFFSGFCIVSPVTRTKGNQIPIVPMIRSQLIWLRDRLLLFWGAMLSREVELLAKLLGGTKTKSQSTLHWSSTHTNSSFDHTSNESVCMYKIINQFLPAVFKSCRPFGRAGDNATI